MRTLKILLSTSKGALPALVLATLLPSGASCSRSTLREQGQAAASGGAGGEGGAGPSSSSSGIGGEGGNPFTTSSSSSSSSGGDFCQQPGEVLQTFVVDVPLEGVPANPGAICAVVASPVQANKAAHVTLAKTSPALNMAVGFVAIDPSLAGTIIGLPTIAVIDAIEPDLLGMQVSNVQPAPGGFTFDAEWPLPFVTEPHEWTQMTVKTTMEVECGPNMGDTRIVESITFIHLCDEETDFAWVSSGDVCNVCDIIAEMAPSPIVPDKAGDDLPLARAMRLRVVPLARCGRTLVLLAENDGGAGLTYEWAPSVGEVTELAPDVVVWTLPEGRGPAQIQAAVCGDDAAAVASFAFREVA